MCRPIAAVIASCAIVLGLSVPAFANTATIEFDYAQNAYGGAGTALYYGWLNGSNTLTSFICDDATHDIGQYSTWKANTWSLSQVVTQNQGAFAGGSDSWEQTATGDAENNGNVAAMTISQSYSAVAYLADLLLTGQDKSYANQIQYAIWQIMDNPAGEGFIGPGSSKFGQTGETMNDTGWWAYEGYLNDTYTNSRIVFYSPDGNKISSGPYTGDIAQEFIGLTAAEPSTVLLLALVLVSGVVLSSTGARWRKKLSPR